MSEPLHTASSRPRVPCSSTITGVVVHGRGAVITRRIELPDGLPSEPFDVVVGSITPLADPGSVRACLPVEGRRLVSIDSRIRVPEVDLGAGPSVQELEELQRQLERMSARQAGLEARAGRLCQFVAIPTGKKQLSAEGPAERAAAALSLNEVAAEALASVETRLVALQGEQARLQRERARVELEDLQRSSAERMGASHPTRELVLHLGEGEGTLHDVEVSYAVPYAAKWWPMYTLRLSDRGKQGTLTMEALVAQRTGEDWTDAQIGLATSEIAFDASLPRLPSLRLGKRQAEPRTGFREPPGGTDKLFDGYDAFRGRLQPSSRTRELVAIAEPKRTTLHEAVPPPPQSFGGAPMMPPAPSAAMADMSMDYDEMAVVSAPAPMARKRSASIGGAMGDLATGLQAAAGAIFADSPPRGGGGGGGPGAPAPEPSHEPGDEWLEFGSLMLAGPEAAGRGRLQRRPSQWQPPTSELYDALESAKRLGLVNPAVSRGLFDYRYDADGTARVPADGRLHRFELRTGSVDSRLVWRTAPVVDPQVYREAEFDNPYDSPLLAGPIDVFSEGQLVTTTRVERVDSGGAMRVGLGVDERIRVARNVRMEEESAGLLGGKRQLTHDVEIELRSGLGEEANVEVFDRVPITDDEHVSVELISSEPRAQDYDQREHGAVLRGGKRWLVTLPAGGKRTIAYRYEVTLRAKDEIVGGNRRG